MWTQGTSRGNLHLKSQQRFVLRRFVLSRFEGHDTYAPSIEDNRSLSGSKPCVIDSPNTFLNVRHVSLQSSQLQRQILVCDIGDDAYAAR